MTAAVGVLCARVRVEEKAIIAALAEAGVPAAPFPPAASPLPIDPPTLAVAPGSEAAPAVSEVSAAGGVLLPAPVLVDRCVDRAVAAAMLPVWRTLGAVTLDAGLAATGNRAGVAGALAAAGLPRPATRLACSEGAALAAIEELGYPTTLLPLEPGSAPIALTDRDTAEAILEHRAFLGRGQEAVSLLQAGAPAAAERTVVIVVDGEAVAAEATAPAPRVTDLARAAAIALGASVAGVVIAAGEGTLRVGGPVVWDVLPVPDFRAATPLGGRDVAAAIAALAAERLAAHREFARLVRLEVAPGETAGGEARALGRRREVAGGIAASA